MRGPRDPGGARGAVVAWVGLAVMLGGVVFLNQFTGKEAEVAPTAVPAPSEGGVSAEGPTSDAPPVAEGTVVVVRVEPPRVDDQFAMGAKLYYKLGSLEMVAGKDRATLMTSIDGGARTVEDRFRAAIVAADLAGAEEGRERLARLEAEEAGAWAERGLGEDAALVRRVLDGGDSELTDAERDRLVERHGWFGELAVALGAPTESPERAALRGGGGALIAFIVAAVVVFGGAGVVVMAVKMSRGRLRPRFVAPSAGGSVYLEAVAVFVGAFAAFKVVVPLLIGMATGGGDPPEWATGAALASQWVLLVVPLYPLLRGVRWGELKAAMGWHRGEGVWREIGAGLLGYFAGLPLLVIAGLITFGGIALRGLLRKGGPGDGGPETMDNPIVELVTTAGPWTLALLFVLATVWAPLVEESVFRGAFYRHLRSRAMVIVAAIGSAVVFGLMHGYDLILLLPVMTIGLVFALVREWRGSLIGPMVAHGLHNATILALVIGLFSILK